MALTLIQAIWIIVAIYGLLVMCFIMVFWWISRNNISLSINKYVDGVLLNTTIRCRANKNKDCFYAMHQFIPGLKKPIMLGKNKITYTQYKDKMIVCDSLPIIGIKKNIEITKTENASKPWLPPNNLDGKGLINNIRMVKISVLRKEIYEMTDNTTKAEIMQRIIVPSLLIVLALACLIFFPKIYQAIQGSATSAMQTATTAWQDQLTTIKPIG